VTEKQEEQLESVESVRQEAEELVTWIIMEEIIFWAWSGREKKWQVVFGDERYVCDKIKRYVIL